MPVVVIGTGARALPAAARGVAGRLRGARRPRGARSHPPRADLSGRHPRPHGQCGLYHDPRRRAQPRGNRRPRRAFRRLLADSGPRLRARHAHVPARLQPLRVRGHAAREAGRAGPDVGRAGARAQQPGGRRAAQRRRAGRRARGARRDDRAVRRGRRLARGRRGARAPAARGDGPRGSAAAARRARGRPTPRTRWASCSSDHGVERRVAARRAARRRRPRRRLARRAWRATPARRCPPRCDWVAASLGARSLADDLRDAHRADLAPRRRDQGLHLHGPGRPAGGRRARRPRGDADHPPSQAQAHADRRRAPLRPGAAAHLRLRLRAQPGLDEPARQRDRRARRDGHDHAHDRAAGTRRASRCGSPTTGPGVPDAAQHRIFEPFYTTKAVGSGTGLGLDTARRIVLERHDGDLELASAPGATTFTVRLPRAPRKGTV